MRKKRLALLCLAMLLIFVGGCGREKEKTLRIAEQFGVAYAPLQVMKDEGLLERIFHQMILLIDIWSSPPTRSANSA